MNQLSIEDQRFLDALRDAVAHALERKRRLGQCAVVWRDGRPVQIGGDAEAEGKRPGAGSIPPGNE